MPRKNKKYHYIYKTTNLINGKYYIGLHTTDNLDDGYIGSGKRLWYSLKKYGRENFECKILEMFSDRKSLIKREKEIINEDLLKDPMCMNLCFGGGGWPNNGNAIGGDKFKSARKYWEIPENKERLKKRMSEQSRKLWNDEEYRKRISNIKPMLGKKHKPETIEKLKGHKRQTGEKNSQYGKPRDEKTKEKIRNSINLKLGKTNNLNHIELKKFKRKAEISNYTHNNIFFSKQRRNKIKEIFEIDISNDFEKNLQKVKSVLTEMYICENKSTLMISKIFNTNSETIRNYLNLFGIPIRNQYLYKDKM